MLGRSCADFASNVRAHLPLRAFSSSFPGSVQMKAVLPWHEMPRDCTLLDTPCVRGSSFSFFLARKCLSDRKTAPFSVVRMRHHGVNLLHKLSFLCSQAA